MSPKAPAATFAAPRALGALRDGRRGVIELVLRQGLYVRFGEDWVGLAEPGAEFGPLSVTVRGLSRVLTNTSPGLPAQVADRRLIVGRCTVSVERLRERRCVAFARSRASGVLADSVAAGRAAPRVLGEPPARLRDGIEQLASGTVPAGIRALAGVGDGLTPAGDDVLAGYAAAVAQAGGSAGLGTVARGRSSPLGLAYLRAADQGELPDAGAALLAAVFAESPVQAAVAARGLRSWGASSGAALAWGIVAAATPVFGVRRPTDRAHGHRNVRSASRL